MLSALASSRAAAMRAVLTPHRTLRPHAGSAAAASSRLAASSASAVCAALDFSQNSSSTGSRHAAAAARGMHSAAFHDAETASMVAAESAAAAPAIVRSRRVRAKAAVAEPREPIVTHYPPPPPIYASKGEAVDPPPRAKEGVVYCRHPGAPFRHYRIGSDATCFNDRTGRYTGGFRITTNTSNPTGVALTDASGAMLKFPRAHVVLEAHGHPPPDATAVAKYRDGDHLNDALSNLYWQTTDEVLQHEVALAAAADPPHTLEFRSLAEYPHWRIGNDGRVWSYLRHRFLQPMISQRGMLVIPPNRVGLLVLLAFGTQADRELLSDQSSERGPVVIEHANGDKLDCRIENLSIRQRAKTQALKSRRPRTGFPACTAPAPTVRLAPLADVRPPNAVEGVEYCRSSYPHMQHYLIGSDATLYNSLTGVWNVRSSPSSEMLVRWFLVLTPAQSGLRSPEFRQLSRAEAVLTAFGYPRPDPCAVVRHRDGDRLNDRLSNLYWQTAADVIRHAQLTPDEAGRTPLFQQHPHYPVIVSDTARVFSVHAHRWLEGSKTASFSLRDPHTREQDSVSLSQLVWEAHRGPLASDEYVRHIDGDRANCHLDNLAVARIVQNPESDSATEKPKRSRKPKQTVALGPDGELLTGGNASAEENAAQVVKKTKLSKQALAAAAVAAVPAAQQSSEEKQ